MSDDLPEYTEGHIEAQLAEIMAELGIRATVRPPAVFLTGSVPSEERRHAVAEAVGVLVPEYEIHNEITVVGAGEPDGQEELR